MAGQSIAFVLIRGLPSGPRLVRDRDSALPCALGVGSRCKRMIGDDRANSPLFLFVVDDGNRCPFADEHF